MTTNNRAPARRRGPNTPHGKEAISANALKHGLRARKHVVLHFEDPEAYLTLLESVRLKNAPVGPVEEGITKDIADCLWRLDRAKLFEAVAMDLAYQDILPLGDDHFTPAQRFERAITAALNNPCVEPALRYQREIRRDLFNAIHELQALQASRILKPSSPPTASGPPW